MDLSPYYGSSHLMFRDQMRKFVSKELLPYVSEWDEAEEVPREIYNKAAEVGLLQVNYPEQYGGIPADRFFSIIVSQELARTGSGGVVAALQSHTLALPPLVHHATEELRERVLPGVLSGQKIAALAVSEPSGGSDVARLKTTARRSGNVYVVNGEKTFISSGMRADYITVAVRTGGEGASGVSLLLVDGNDRNIKKTPLKKMGWWASDTATLFFDNCEVPVSNLIGTENEGFRYAMTNFNDERLGLSATAIALAKLACDEALEYARLRQTFGRRLADHQVIRHKIVDMMQRVEASQAQLESIAWELDRGANPIARLCMLKNQATQTLAFCASEAVQILGGAGYVRGSTVERIYRDVKVYAIGGGAEEIMKDLAARQLKF